MARTPKAKTPPPTIPGLAEVPEVGASVTTETGQTVTNHGNGIISIDN